MHMRGSSAALLVGLLVAGGAGCKKETPIQRAERLCLKQELGSIDKDASEAMRALSESGARLTCSAGPMVCGVDASSSTCRDFIQKYK